MENDITSLREEMIERLDDLKKGQYELHKLITGNGEVEKGVLYRLKIVESSVNEMQHALKDHARKRDYWVRWAVGGSVAAIASSAWAWFAAHAHITP